jgi:hypothetical protein
MEVQACWHDLNRKLDLISLRVLSFLEATEVSSLAKLAVAFNESAATPAIPPE